MKKNSKKKKKNEDIYFDSPRVRFHSLPFAVLAKRTYILCNVPDSACVKSTSNFLLMSLKLYSQLSLLSISVYFFFLPPLSNSR